MVRPAGRHHPSDNISGELSSPHHKPGHRPQTRQHGAIYLRPFASVTDDFGNSFPRGEWMPINSQDWQVLKECFSSKLFSTVATEFVTGLAHGK